MNRWAALSTWRARRNRIGAALVLAAFAAGVGAGAGLYLGIDGLYVTLTAPPPGGAAMAAIGNDLAQSASVRPLIQSAILEVQACATNLSSAQETLRQASSSRQAVLENLKTLSVSDLPNGARLVSTLTTAMQDSLDADNDYYAWMTDLSVSGHGCGSNSTQYSNYTKAETDSANATTAKEAFLAIWNPMAPRYGQPTYSYTGF